MSFHDALYSDVAALGDVGARRVDSGLEVLAGHGSGQPVMVTELGLLDLFVLKPFDILVDARLNGGEVEPALHGLAKLSIGIGPGFHAGCNCDIAIETHPDSLGFILQEGATVADAAPPPLLGGKGRERFGYAPHGGLWHTAVEIGTLIFKDFPIGRLGATAVTAPFDGYLRGVVRDGQHVAAGDELFEIDPRGRNACWSGMDDRARLIASAVTKAIRLKRANIVAGRVAPMHIVQ